MSTQTTTYTTGGTYTYTASALLLGGSVAVSASGSAGQTLGSVKGGDGETVVATLPIAAGGTFTVYVGDTSGTAGHGYHLGGAAANATYGNQGGLAAFQAHEIERAGVPLPPGPFKPLLEALQPLQAAGAGAPMRIRTALVTARSAPAHERAIRTLMAWNIQVDEAMFLGGLEKADFLREFEPDFFFDDQTGTCDTASRVSPTGHVVSGVKNEVDQAAREDR